MVFLDADPWGHSIKKLIDDLVRIDKKVYNSLKNLGKNGMILDRFYIPTRYPNGLPDITPNVAFAEEDAINCIDLAQLILDKVKDITGL